jgi:hypothetical protein
MRPRPETPLRPSGKCSEAQYTNTVNVPAGYEYSHTALPSGECFTGDDSAQNSQHNTDFDQNMLTDEGTSTG